VHLQNPAINTALSNLNVAAGELKIRTATNKNNEALLGLIMNV